MKKKSYKRKKLFTVVILFLIVLTFSGLSCTLRGTLFAGNDPSDLTKEEVILIVWRAVRFLIDIAAIVTGTVVIIGGLQYLTAFGDKERTERAKRTLTWAIIGAIIVLVGYAAMRFFFNDIIEVDNPYMIKEGNVGK